MGHRPSSVKLLAAAKAKNWKPVQRLIDSQRANMCLTEIRDPLSGLTLLHLAAIQGHTDMVQSLLEIKCALNDVDKSMHSAVGFAAAGNHVDILQLLLNAKADVNLLDVHGHGPLFAAAIRGFCHITVLLLEAKANADVRDCDGMSPLHHACTTGKIEVVRILLSASFGDVIDSINNFGHTPLYSAVIGGHVELVECLLVAKADLHRVCHDASVIDWARKCKQAEVLEVLLKHER